jgi:hypothetical protein
MTWIGPGCGQTVQLMPSVSTFKERKIEIWFTTTKTSRSQPLEHSLRRLNWYIYHIN